MPRIWEAPLHLFNYTLSEVTSAFYDRYPNSRAGHVVSEDVLSRQVTHDRIVTRKLIVKKGAVFLKAVPGWIARRLPDAQFMPTVEESIYHKRDQTLTTYTRNVSWLNVMQMDERSVYSPLKESPEKTSLERTVHINVDYGRISGIAEQILLMAFRKSSKRASEGIVEKLHEFYDDSSTIGTSNEPCAAKMKRKIAERLHLDKKP